MGWHSNHGKCHKYLCCGREWYVYIVCCVLYDMWWLLSYSVGNVWNWQPFFRFIWAKTTLMTDTLLQVQSCVFLCIFEKLNLVFNGPEGLNSLLCALNTFSFRVQALLDPFCIQHSSKQWRIEFCEHFHIFTEIQILELKRFWDNFKSNYFFCRQNNKDMAYCFMLQVVWGKHLYFSVLRFLYIQKKVNNFFKGKESKTGCVVLTVNSPKSSKKPTYEAKLCLQEPLGLAKEAKCICWRVDKFVTSL